MKHHETVGGHLVASVLHAKLGERAGAVLERLAKEKPSRLLVGFAGSALATAAMAGFESTFSRNLAVAFFVPGIVYLADAIGTQSEANMRLAAAVASAIFAAGTVAAALGSGPLATVIQDIVSLLVYFAVVQAFLL